MGNKATISKQMILATAYELVAEQGAGALSMRNIAERCGVSVGSIYNYYPQKTELLADTLEMFWKDAINSESLSAMHPAQGEGFVAFCERLMDCLEEPLARFRETWLKDIGQFGSKEIAAGRSRENHYFAHIKRGLEAALENDGDIDESLFCEGLTKEALCSHIWDVMLMYLRRGDDASTLFALLRRALYKN